MQDDFHYYATYCAAYLAGFSHEESLAICYSANLTDLCSKTFLSKIKAPKKAATTQLSMEMADMRTDYNGIADITRIWSSFHFLPRDLKAEVKGGSKKYKNKYRLICGPNGDLLVDTINLAKGKSLQAIGLSMHVLADTWAHRYFAGTPSLVINNTDSYFYELIPNGDSYDEYRLSFRHSLNGKDDLDNKIYNKSIFQFQENSIMNTGHGRAGHIPDYSFIRYKYLPAWGKYQEFIKDNPSDYSSAFHQMVYALRFLRGDIETFEKETYDTEVSAPYDDEIHRILEKRQHNAGDDWKALGQRITGRKIPDFDIEQYQAEYMDAEEEEKDNTFLGRYILAAIDQKSMVTHKIWSSGNPLAGRSISGDRLIKLIESGKVKMQGSAGLVKDQTLTDGKEQDGAITGGQENAEPLQDGKEADE